MPDLNLEKLMEKLEHDNEVLKRLDQKLKKVTVDTGLSNSLPSLNTAAAKTTVPGTSTPTHLPSTTSKIPTAAALSSLTGAGDHHQHHQHSFHQQQSQLQQQYPNLPRPPTALSQLQQQPTHQLREQIEDLKQAEEIVDSIEIPNRGRCKVFMARYHYDPYKQSPNENPDAEVTLICGDFILVFGGVDEDGFYYGELLDGRRGLVPSNFIEKLTGEDLFEFQASVLYGHKGGNVGGAGALGGGVSGGGGGGLEGGLPDSDTASFPPEFYDAILTETLGHTNFQHLLAPGKCFVFILKIGF